MDFGYIIINATATVSAGGVDATVIAAPGAGKQIKLISGVITITAAGTGGTSIVALEDGLNGTKILPVSADAVGWCPFVFGPDGYALTPNTALNFTTDGAGTVQATARVTLLAKVTV